jgi:glycosyltransferase involved in cell wall biosynthesis
VFLVQDLWPDFPIQMGALPNPWLQRRLYALERRLYTRAAHVIPYSPDMEAHILRHGIAPDRVTTHLNGTDFWLLDACTPADVATLRDAHGLAGKQVVLYGGTFGRANDIPTLIQAAERLTHRRDVQFVFVGHGFLTNLVREAAGRLPNVTLIPPQPRHRMPAWFKLAALSVISFIDLPVLSTNSPAKFFDSLGAGTPVVVTNPGWTRRFVEEHGCGWYVPPSNPEALMHRLDAVLADPEALATTGKRGAAVARRQFDREVMAGQLEAILLDVVGQAGS